MAEPCKTCGTCPTCGNRPAPAVLPTPTVPWPWWTRPWDGWWGPTWIEPVVYPTITYAGTTTTLDTTACAANLGSYITVSQGTANG